jgi:hypothetical protein
MLLPCFTTLECVHANAFLLARCRELFTAEFVEGGIDLMADVNNAAHAWAQDHAFGAPDRWSVLPELCNT